MSNIKFKTAFSFCFAVFMIWALFHRVPWSGHHINKVAIYDNTLIVIVTHLQGYQNRNPLLWNPEKSGVVDIVERYFVLTYDLGQSDGNITNCATFTLPHLEGCSNEIWQAVSKSKFLYTADCEKRGPVAKYWDAQFNSFAGSMNIVPDPTHYIGPAFITTRSGSRIMANTPHGPMLNAFDDVVLPESRVKDLTPAIIEVASKWGRPFLTENLDYLYFRTSASGSDFSIVGADGVIKKINFDSLGHAEIRQIEYLEGNFWALGFTEDAILLQNAEKTVYKIAGQYDQFSWKPKEGVVLLVPRAFAEIDEPSLQRPLVLWSYSSNSFRNITLNCEDLLRGIKRLARQ